MIAVIVSMSPHVVLADSPPPWEPFSVISTNGQFRASVEAVDAQGGNYPWERKFRIAVSRIVEGKKSVPVWSAAYKYRGYPDGAKLSDDGEYFAQLDYWYRHDDAAIQIQNRERDFSVTGRALGVRPESLAKTVSHQLWVKNAGDFQFEYAGTTTSIVINSLQGPKRVELPAS